MARHYSVIYRSRAAAVRVTPHHYRIFSLVCGRLILYLNIICKNILKYPVLTLPSFPTLCFVYIHHYRHYHPSSSSLPYLSVYSYFVILFNLMLRLNSSLPQLSSPSLLFSSSPSSSYLSVLTWPFFSTSYFALYLPLSPPPSSSLSLYFHRWHHHLICQCLLGHSFLSHFSLYIHHYHHYHNPSYFHHHHHHLICPPLCLRHSFVT